MGTKSLNKPEPLCIQRLFGVNGKLYVAGGKCSIKPSNGKPHGYTASIFYIQLPPGVEYPVSLDGWENLGKVTSNAVVCYVPVKKDILTAEHT